MKFFKKKLFKLIIVLLVFCSPAFSLAQSKVPGPVVLLENPIGNTTTIQAVIAKVLVAVIKMGIPVVALAIIYSGFLFVKAQGNPEEITKAKDALLYSLIGAGILLGAWSIAQAVLDTVKLLVT
jgi:hypothetical protein